MNDYINKALKQMKALGFEVRDTYIPHNNQDDFYINGNTYGGISHFRIEWIDTNGCPGIRANKQYSIPNYESVAYDDYRIEMPLRYKELDREDAIIHETTHFIQKNTKDDESNYIQFNNSNYPQYIGQRTEYEAHLVQISHIIENQLDYYNSKIPENMRDEFESNIECLQNQPDTSIGIRLILKAKNLKLI